MKRRLAIALRLTVGALLVVAAAGLIIHRLFQPTDKNHVIIINNTSETIDAISVQASQDLASFTFTVGKSTPGQIKVINFPRQFASNSKWKVTWGQRLTVHTIDRTPGRYGHTLIILLGREGVEMHFNKMQGVKENE